MLNLKDELKEIRIEYDDYKQCHLTKPGQIGTHDNRLDPHFLKGLASDSKVELPEAFLRQYESQYAEYEALFENLPQKVWKDVVPQDFEELKKRYIQAKGATAEYVLSTGSPIMVLINMRIAKVAPRERLAEISESYSKAVQTKYANERNDIFLRGEALYEMQLDFFRSDVLGYPKSVKRGAMDLVSKVSPEDIAGVQVASTKWGQIHSSVLEKALGFKIPPERTLHYTAPNHVGHPNDFNRHREESIPLVQDTSKTHLIMDDSIETGETLKCAIGVLKNQGVSPEKMWVYVLLSINEDDYVRDGLLDTADTFLKYIRRNK